MEGSGRGMEEGRTEEGWKKGGRVEEDGRRVEGARTMSLIS